MILYDAFLGTVKKILFFPLWETEKEKIVQQLRAEDFLRKGSAGGMWCLFRNIQKAGNTGAFADVLPEEITYG